MSIEQSKAELREIEREIVSALIFSKEGRLLMGRKDPKKGGVWTDRWHIPGGGVDEGESLDQALHREIEEEVGIDITPYEVDPLPEKGSGTTEKTLKSGERVLCHMNFNYFKVIVDKNSDEIRIKLSDDLIETRWFSREELLTVQQVPGGREFFQKIGLIPNEQPDRGA